MDKLTQADKRKKYNNLSTIELFERYYSEGGAKRLNIFWINSDDIILTPKLLQKTKSEKHAEH